MRRLGNRLFTLLFVVMLVLAASSQVALAQSLPEFPSDARILLIDEQTGEILVEQNADERAYPASLTKMMTALVALDEIGDQLDEYVEVGEEVSLTPYDSTVMGLEEGDVFTWRELLYGMLVPSGSDAAFVIATHVGRAVTEDENLSVEAALGVFIDLMNRRADEMGLTNTHYANVHGYHDDNHYTTARDLLTLIQAVRANDLLREICGTATYSCASTTGRELTVYSTNWLIDQTCSGIDEYGLLEDEGEPGVANPYYRAEVTGVKTGYTGEAGRCLAYACDGGIPVVGVVLGLIDQPTLYTLMDHVTDALVNSFEHRTLAETEVPQELEITNVSLFERLQGKTVLRAAAADSVTHAIDTSCSYESQLSWDKNYVSVAEDGTAKLVTVVSAGTQVATLEFLRDGEVIEQVPLFAETALTPYSNRDTATLVVIGVGILIVLGVIIASIVAGAKRRRRRRTRNQMRNRGQERQMSQMRNQKLKSQHSSISRSRRDIPTRRKPSHMR